MSNLKEAKKAIKKKTATPKNTMPGRERPKTYLDLLSGECNALADRFRLDEEQKKHSENS